MMKKVFVYTILSLLRSPSLYLSVARARIHTQTVLAIITPVMSAFPERETEQEFCFFNLSDEFPFPHCFFFLGYSFCFFCHVFCLQQLQTVQFVRKKIADMAYDHLLCNSQHESKNTSSCNLYN